MLEKLFPINENAVDRIVRILLGVGLLTLAFIGPRSPWGFVGIVPLLTGILGSCPAYTVFGLSTCAYQSTKTT